MADVLRLCWWLMQLPNPYNFRLPTLNTINKNHFCRFYRHETNFRDFNCKLMWQLALLWMVVRHLWMQSCHPLIVNGPISFYIMIFSRFMALKTHRICSPIDEPKTIRERENRTRSLEIYFLRFHPTGQESKWDLMFDSSAAPASAKTKRKSKLSMSDECGICYWMTFTHEIQIALLPERQPQHFPSSVPGCTAA